MSKVIAPRKLAKFARRENFYSDNCASLAGCYQFHCELFPCLYCLFESFMNKSDCFPPQVMDVAIKHEKRYLCCCIKERQHVLSHRFSIKWENVFHQLWELSCKPKIKILFPSAWTREILKNILYLQHSINLNFCA